MRVGARRLIWDRHVADERHREEVEWREEEQCAEHDHQAVERGQKADDHDQR